jgi:uncharacterized protein (DUF1697 family)
MAQVVFLRGVNVGGNKTFRPSALAKELAEFDVVNVGAAGTFVVRGALSPAKLRSEVLRRLPFKAEVMVCRGRDLVALMRSEPFRNVHDKDVRPFVCVMQKAPQKLPPLPLARPEGSKWEVKLLGVVGECALAVWRRQGKGILYPNEVVEKTFGQTATTRSWNTIVAICKILET